MNTYHLNVASNTPLPTQKLTIHASSTLMQDVMSSGEISVDAGSPSAVALFANPFKDGQVEALVIDAGGRLTYLRRGDSGWTQIPISSGDVTLAKEVVVATTPDGAVWAFYANPDSGLAYALLGDDTWTITKTQSRGWKNMKVSYSAGVPMRIPVVYGLDSDPHPQPYTNALKIAEWYPESQPKWRLSAAAPDPNTSLTLVGTAITLYQVADESTPRARDYRLIGVRYEGQYQAAMITYFELVEQTPGTYAWFIKKCDYQVDTWTTDPVPILMAGPVDRYGLYLLGGMAMDEVVSNGVKGFHYSNEGISFKEAVAFSDYNMLMHIYGIGYDGIVSVLHQTGWMAARHENIDYTLPVWAKSTDERGRSRIAALPFDKDAKKLFVDAFPDSRPSVLIFHNHSEPVLATQDLVSGQWWSEPVRLDSNQPPIAVSAYRTQATLVNEQGTPIAGHRLTVSADSLVQIKVGGVTHLIGPESSVEVTTDLWGRATFSVQATGLTTPNLVLNAPGLQSGVVIKPATSVQNYLAGTGTLPHKQKLTGAVLKSATVDGGKPLIPPSSWPADNPKFPDDVVHSIQQVFAAGGAGPMPPTLLADGRHAQIAGFVIQTFDSTRPAYRAFSSIEELEMERGRHRTYERYGGIIDDVGGFLDDLWEGVKRAGARIGSAIVNLVDGVVDLFVWIGGSFMKLGKFIIKTFKDAANVVMAVFNTLKAEIDKVVDWLSAMFNFKDIWDTKMALEGGLTYFPTFLSNTMQAHGITGAKIRTFFTDQEASVRADLDQFALKYKGQTLQDLPGWNADSAIQIHAPDRLLFQTPNGPITRGDLDGPQANWLLDLILPNSGHIPGGTTLPNLDSAWNSFMAVFSGIDYSFYIGFIEGFKKLLREGNPDTLGQIVIDAFIELLKGMVTAVFRFVAAILSALLDLVNAVLAAAATVLRDPITFAPLLTLVHWIEGEAYPGQKHADVTLAGIFCLLMAFPATLGWKLVMGADNAPFPGGKFPTTTDKAVSGSSPNLFIFFGGLVQMFYFFPDMTNDMVTSVPKGKDFGILVWWAVLSEFLLPMLLWPTAEGIPFSPLPEAKKEDRGQMARYFNWLPGIAIALLDLASAVASDPSDRKLARNMEWKPASLQAPPWAAPPGKVSIAVLGLNNLVGGIFDSVENKAKDATFAANVLSPLSATFQFLRIPPPTQPNYLLIAKAIINLAGDAGGGIARCVSAWD